MTISFSPLFLNSSLNKLVRVPGIQILLAFFILCNVSIRLAVLYDENLISKIVYLSCIIIGVFLCFFPRFLNWILFLFALTFPLYGGHSYSAYSHVFEFILSTLTLVLIILNFKTGKLNNRKFSLVGLLSLYIFISFVSLLLLPISFLVQSIALWGLRDFSRAVFVSVPDSIFYPLAGVNRLVLFFTFVYQLSRRPDGNKSFYLLFLGILFSAVMAASIGFLDQYHFINLNWYRDKLAVNRLQSFFLNPGWYAEFISVAIPFILLGFVRKTNNIVWIGFLLLVLILFEISILLTGSRTGWVVYPLILCICWLFFYISRKTKDSEFKTNWKEIFSVVAKVAVSVPITIIISFVLIFQVFENPRFLSNIISKQDQVTSSNSLTSKSDVKNTQYIKQRMALSQLTSPSTRGGILRDSFHLMTEAPLFGLGYESYGWHASILGQIPDSEFSKNRRIKSEFDTPHNIFAQIVISNGIVGLILWLSILGYMVLLCISQFREKGDYLAICVILSVISFHVYGLAQSMQYIPVIWFLFFLNAGYCMTLEDISPPVRLKKFLRGWQIFLVSLVVVGCGVYLFNHSSRPLAEKYKLWIYAQDQSRDQYPGFYPLEHWSQGDFRWTGKRAVMRFSKSGLVEFKIYCGHPGIDKRPVNLSVSLNNKVIDHITFTENRFITKQYYIPISESGENELQIKVSPAFSPLKSGMNEDPRKLGVAIGDIHFMNQKLNEGIGLYDFEPWNGDHITDWPKDISQQFRWSTDHALLKINQKHVETGISLYLLALHPDIQTKGKVRVKIRAEDKILFDLEVGNQWQTVFLSPELLAGAEVLSFSVNRTWNPFEYKVSEDRRDLGVGIASPQWLKSPSTH